MGSVVSVVVVAKRLVSSRWGLLLGTRFDSEPFLSLPGDCSPAFRPNVTRTPHGTKHRHSVPTPQACDYLSFTRLPAALPDQRTMRAKRQKVKRASVA